MTVHLHKFLRKAPVASLKGYLCQTAPDPFAEVDWSAKRGVLVELLAKTIGTLDDEPRNQLFSDVERVGQFNGVEGRRVLRGVLSDTAAIDAFDATEGSLLARCSS